MQAFFMRHGQTAYNIQALCNDDPHRDVRLTELGVRQAQAAAERLRGVPLARILVSELPRTRQTGEIVNRYHNVPIETHAAINDIRSGFDGRPVIEYQRAIAHDPLHAAVNGGESLLAHKARVMGFLDWLETLDETALLVVAHEETLRVVAARYRGLDDDAMRAVSIANAEVWRFDL
ncbi:MAG: histidine phosphatase family protein [Gammaproteobacteria bacterium]